MSVTALAGLLGSGKSSVVRELGSLAPYVAGFVEPEEPDYPSFVSQGVEDPFGVHSWFRASRVYNLSLAQAASIEGSIAVVDSYYDRMLSTYVDHDAFDWILGGKESYREILRSLSRVDRRELPSVDRLIFLHVEEQDWRMRIRARMRDQDRILRIADRFAMQRPMVQACEEIAQLDGCELVILQTTGRSVREVAALIRDAIS